MESSAQDPGGAGGWCAACGIEHRLAAGPALPHARTLQRDLQERRRLDGLDESAPAGPRITTDYLFGPALGQMFGVLVGVDRNGAPVVLRAFSGQYDSRWNIAGWSPPLFDVAAHARIMIPGDHRIKDLGRRIAAADPDSPERRRLTRVRKELSRSLMKELHALYAVRNFRGGARPLAGFYDDRQGPPTGAGDCCAPKLLNEAIVRGIRPLGLAEFYWGATNRSGTRSHGRFYAACDAKCRPLLGFMLCGARP